MCDIFALSSLWEALPYSLLDAMALGKPVVTTDTLGPKEFVEDGRNGFVVPKQRPAALAEAITKLLRMDEADRLRLGQNSINIIKEKADINKAVEKTEGLYERLLSEA
ncbi:MAG: glycosyltransferase family 4 protein [Candidatus Omnitrophota bacterium]